MAHSPVDSVNACAARQSRYEIRSKGLLDILDPIDVVGNYLPHDRALFDRDPPLQSHIYRHIMIIGEAAWKLSDAVKQRHPSIPWDRIQGMRHILVHEYFKVDWDVVFSTARDYVPALRPQIEAILAALPPDPQSNITP